MTDRPPTNAELLEAFGKAAAEFLTSPAMKALADGIVAGGVRFGTECAKALREAAEAKPPQG